jgi:hypothetical protein
MVAVVIIAMARQMASPLVVTTTISWLSSIPSSYLEEKKMLHVPGLLFGERDNITLIREIGVA